MKNIQNLIGVLLVSGILSGFCNISAGFVSFFGPGILFGIATAIWFHMKYQTSIPRLIGWVVGSTISYFFAVLVLLGFNSPTGTYYFGFAIAGGVGAAFLVLFKTTITQESDAKRKALTIFIGAIAGLIFYLFQKFNIPFLTYIVWQLAVGLVLAL